MTSRQPARETPVILQEILGYLNFSSGASDPHFLGNLCELYRRIETAGVEEAGTHEQVRDMLLRRLAELEHSSPAFDDIQQASGVLQVALANCLGAYRAWHRDLLYHVSDAALWRPLMLGRVLEAVLGEGPPWNDPARIVSGALATLNDYIGHRPVAVLRTQQRIEPYPHEWLRPLPLYVREVGVAPGRYQRLIELALGILRETDSGLLADAHFELDLLDELAVDPRAYDFDHPVNKRPNYLFGQWDPHHLDNHGRYRRFVLQQVTLDALLDRVDGSPEPRRGEILVEAAVVLAGTMLMASGTSGRGPDAHDSTLTLSKLVPQIAAYRDRFYHDVLVRLAPEHGTRLGAEAAEARQPLAAARQHLNHYLARLRAMQLERVHVAMLYAGMGYSDAALTQAHVVASAHARMRCEIECRLAGGHLAIERGELARAGVLVDEIRDLLDRAIQCGAMVDPWNILGFQAQFSLFPAPENSVPDHRVEELIALVQRIVGLHLRVIAAAAATGSTELGGVVMARLEQFAPWWDKFATTTVDAASSFSAAGAVEAAKIAADALQTWHAAGKAAGSIAFWHKQVENRRSAQAYALIAQALLEKRDYLAALALLMQWLSQAEEISLRQGEHSFFALLSEWLARVCDRHTENPLGEDDRSQLVRRFFDFLAANAEEYWQFPELHLASADGAIDDLEPDDDDSVVGAAYDDMVYVDSTADGFDADMLEAGSHKTDYELEHAARLLRDRLRLMDTAAELWKKAGLDCGFAPPAAEGSAAQEIAAQEIIDDWLSQARRNAARLEELLAQVHSEPVAPPGASRDSLVEFDRRRQIKENLLEQVVVTTVDTRETIRILKARQPPTVPSETAAADELVLQAAIWGDWQKVATLWPELETQLAASVLLYVPTARGGNLGRALRARLNHQLLRDLAQRLPRLGLFGLCCQLVYLGRTLEADHPVGPAAVTEFDRLFEVAYREMVESLVRIADGASGSQAVATVSGSDAALIETMEQLTEIMLKQWLAHSRTLRLSALEKIVDEAHWRRLVSFIESYGHDLFTQKFLNLANLRSILHQGVDTWLAQLEAEADADEDLAILKDLGSKIPRTQAVKDLSLILEAIAENYAEYRDYNSTTTQSDRGELLYTLLDFLRLRAAYDRVAWHLRPLATAHDVLVRHGRLEAADEWRRGIAERTAEVADALLARCAALEQKHGMRLASVAERLRERFVQPLVTHRLEALVEPAMREAAPSEAFRLLEQEIEELLERPTSAGHELPSWLVAVTEEVQRVLARRRDTPGDAAIGPHAQRFRPLEDIQSELALWDEQLPTKP